MGEGTTSKDRRGPIMCTSKPGPRAVWPVRLLWILQSSDAIRGRPLLALAVTVSSHATDVRDEGRSTVRVGPDLTKGPRADASARFRNDSGDAGSLRVAGWDG